MSGKASKIKRTRQIHVLTDGTGGLPRHYLTAVLSQFPSLKQQPQYHVFCSTPKQATTAYNKYVKKNSIVFHTFVRSDTKAAIEQLAKSHSVPSFDLTGSAVDFLSTHYGVAATEEIGLVHSRGTDYFDRIDAWEFSLQHDDSRRLETVGKAEFILVGISRVSKTPTSSYLGWLGYRVANVSFDPEQGLPKEIKKYRKKAIALTIQPKQLSEIRSRRMQVNGFADVIVHDPEAEIRYAGLKDTIREVMAAEQFYRELKLPVIDVTHSTVEETAARILQVIPRASK